MPTQPTTSRQGWVAQKRAQRASVPVESRSWAARCCAPFVYDPLSVPFSLMEYLPAPRLVSLM